jgi:hypothetical protein
MKKNPFGHRAIVLALLTTCVVASASARATAGGGCLILPGGGMMTVNQGVGLAGVPIGVTTGAQSGAGLASLAAGGTSYVAFVSGSSSSLATFGTDPATRAAMEYRDFRARASLGGAPAGGAALASIAPSATNAVAAAALARYPNAIAAAGSEAEALSLASFAAAAGREAFWGRVFNLFQFFARNNPWFDASPFLPFLQEVFQGIGGGKSPVGPGPGDVTPENADIATLQAQVVALRQEVRTLTAYIRPELRVGDVIEEVFDATGRITVKRGTQTFETASLPGLQKGDVIFEIKPDGSILVNRNGAPATIAAPVVTPPPTPGVQTPKIPEPGQPGQPAQPPSNTIPVPGNPGTPAGPASAAASATVPEAPAIVPEAPVVPAPPEPR